MYRPKLSENGVRRDNVPGLTLIKLADFFQVSLDYLVGRSDDREQ